jgi:hypothetical protein
MKNILQVYIYHKTQVDSDVKHYILENCQNKIYCNFIPSHLIDSDIHARH